MLSPNEIAVGSFPQADGLTLMLPRTRLEERILITSAGPEKVAVYLGSHKYAACPCGESDGWKGLLIAAVTIEMDESSVFDPGCDDAPLGALIREGTGLNIIAKIKDNHHFDRAQPVILMTGLPASAERQAAGFRRWRIVIGEGEDKRELHAVDLVPPKAQA